MKSTILIYIFFINLTVYSQEDSISTKFISGNVIDSSTNEPIAFAFIRLNKKVSTNTDLDGNFKIKVSPDTSVSMTVSATNYEKKFLEKITYTKPVTIKLKYTDKEFIISGNPIDTTYYKSGKIERINYQYRDQITFYENGQIKLKTVDGSHKEFYENGKLKSQSILTFNHYRTETRWYDNGQMKERGSIYWGDNKNTHAGDWFNSNDWKYWDKNGKEINK